MINPCAVTSFRCVPVEAQPGCCGKTVGGSGLINAPLASDDVSWNNTCRNLQEDKEERCHHGKSYMHFLSHASKCFIHNQMHIMPADVQSCCIFKKKCFWKLKHKSFFFFCLLFHQGWKDLHGSDYPQSTTLLSFKVSLRYPSCITPLHIIQLRKNTIIVYL